mmetsp:Transcript_3221/g.4359  ORF Transcript_3221/g.4359 Transcript_3221/m.4359 type:complete len:398 (+) Transcript_3221:106-1299(+)
MLDIKVIGVFLCQLVFSTIVLAEVVHDGFSVQMHQFFGVDKSSGSLHTCTTLLHDIRIHIPLECMAALDPDKKSFIYRRSGTFLMVEAIRNSSYHTNDLHEADFFICPSTQVKDIEKVVESLSNFNNTKRRFVFGINTNDLGWKDFRIAHDVHETFFSKTVAQSVLISYFGVNKGQSSVCHKGMRMCLGDFRQGQDLISHAVNRLGDDVVSLQSPWITNKWLTRDLVLYFSGRTKNKCNVKDPRCSAISSRAQLQNIKKKGYIYVGVPKSREEDINFFQRSLFCFCPLGVNGGYGFRYVRAIRNGCIPIIMNDGRPLPYDQVLKYHDFSVVIPKFTSIEKMIAIVENVKGNSTEVKRLRDGLAYSWKYFSWYHKTLDVIVASLHHNYCARDTQKESM